MAILIIQHAESCAPGLLGDALSRFGQRTVIVRTDRGQSLPADLGDVHGVVSLGGPQSANDAEPWVAQETALLKLAHQTGVPILGLCLGAQLLARALGGTVARMPKPELGWAQMSNVSVDKEDALFTGLPWKQTYFCWHEEFVSKLPEGATVLQRNEACPVQAYRVGPWSYGIQYHPEWNRQTILKEIGQATEQELAAAGTTAELLRQGTHDHYESAERMARKIFELCNLMLFPASRLQPGLVARSPLHH